MKPALLIVSFIFLFSVATKAQTSAPQLLKSPADWTFERFALPPVFAPNFPYKGAEELRFSPGMFDKNSTQYFTYAFVAQLNGRSNISKEEVKNYLLYYFKGLCGHTAKDRKLVVDTSKISVAIEKKKDAPSGETIYNALLQVFGVFADGAPVQLNMEVKVLTDTDTKQVYLFFIASPHEKSDEQWKLLYMLQKNFAIPAEEKK